MSDQRYAQVNISTNRVENLLVLDNTAVPVAPSGFFYIQTDTANMGDVYDGSNFAAYVPTSAESIATAKNLLAQLDASLPRWAEDLTSKMPNVPPVGSKAREVLNQKRALRAQVRGSSDGASVGGRVTDHVLNEVDEKIDEISAAFAAIGAASSTGLSAITATAPNNAPTNYGVLAAILGADANSTNAKQNATANVVNDDLKPRINTLITKVDALVTIVNALRTAGVV